MIPFFLVNSPGGSGTKWLANLLNQHPSVMCFHALRRRDWRSDDPVLNPDDLIDHLIEEKSKNEWCRSVGSVHSYHGAEGYQEILRRGGEILGIIRDPIRRIHSLISTHWKDINGPGNISSQNIYEDIKNNGDLRLLNTKNVAYSSDVEKRFTELSYLSLQGDLSLFYFFENKKLVFFEKMVEDFDYLRYVIMRNFLFDISYAENIFKEKVNSHSYTLFETEMDIIRSWPAEFKIIYLEIAKNKLSELIDFYQRSGYPFGDYVSDMYKSLAVDKHRLEMAGR